jgi:glutamate dehydrogenase (NAD(P)+)
MTTNYLRELGLGPADAFDELARNPSLDLEEAAHALDLESWIVDRLRHPVHESTSYLQLVRDSGDVVCLPLFQVQHSAVFGSTIGSLSLQPDLQLRTCEAMAMERTWQAALLGLPLGGASYGLVCDPDELSERELMRLLTAAAPHVRSQPGKQAIVFSGDGCRRECIAKLFAETRDSGNLNVAGKPECLGGLNLDHFTAEGIAAMLTAELRRTGKAPATAKVAIQGFGSLGQAVSERLARERFIIVGLSDNSGGLYRSDGLILADIRSHYDREPILFGYSQADHISRAELLQSKSDIVVLASGSNEIHANNANTVSASLVIEADWGGVTSAGKRTLAARNLTVIPWLVSAGGAPFGAWFESCGANVTSTSEDLLSRTHACVERALAAVVRYSCNNKKSVNDAARQLAVERVAAGVRLNGQ